MQKIFKVIFFSGIFASLLSIILIIGTYLVLKPSLPEIKYVDESELQMPVKLYK